jgi:homoserine kinase type II
VRDLRAEHVLFCNREVSGVVDYGALAADYPGVDLARLMAGFDPPRFRAGRNAYRVAGGNLEEPDEFLHLLSRSGLVCAVIGWLQRFREGDLRGIELTAAEDRVERLLSRLNTRQLD